MNLITVIGATGQGKTTLVNKMIEGKNQYVFDVNNEYKNLPDDRQKFVSQMRNVDMDIKRFISNCSRLRNTNIVFEDATGFLRGRQGEQMARLMVAKRHTNNNYIILFHSINRVPPEIMEMSNFVLLMRTRDNANVIQQKFDNEQLTEAFLKLQNLPKFSYIKINMI